MAQKKTVSVVVPVWNECRTISQTVDHIRRVAAHSRLATVVQIVVSDGHPQGSTLEALEDIEDMDALKTVDNIETVDGPEDIKAMDPLKAKAAIKARDASASGGMEVVPVRSPAGRGAQMNAGAEAASGDNLLFLHADTRLPDKAFDLVVEALATGLPLAGAFDLDIDTTGLSWNKALGLGVVAWFARLRSRLERKPYGDQGFFIARDDFRRLGGFPELPIMEDVAMHRRILSLGEDIVILPQRVRTSPRRWLKEGIVSRTLRNWRLRLKFALGVSAERLVADYRPNTGEEA